MLLMLVLFVMFVMILGLFFKQTKEGYGFSESHPKWFKFFVFLIFIITILFVLNAWPASNGETMLVSIFGSIAGGSSGELVGGLILLAIIIGAIALVVTSKGKPEDDDGDG